MRAPRVTSRINRAFYDYKRNSKRHGREFSLTFEQFKEITAKNCHYCGAKPTQRIHIIRKEEQVLSLEAWNGIDRKDNNIGYIYSNCLPCCGVCNRLKSNYSLEQFFEHIVKIYRHRKL